MYFWTDEEDPLVVDNDTTIIADVLVPDWHPDVKEDVLTILVCDDPREHFPGVEVCVTCYDILG